MKLTNNRAFAVWLTGLPASGKSTISKELERRLEGLSVAVLESDALRPIFTPQARYDAHDREFFYRQLAFVAALLVRHGVPVIIDATANLRCYREHARQQIARFFEVYVDTPLAVCVSRDPKGIYRSGQAGSSQNVPGLHVPYEPPEKPDLIVHGDGEEPGQAAERIVNRLLEMNFLAG